jgi:hypothetical protein
MFTKEDLQLPKEINQAVVDGVIRGYADYLDERAAKRRKLRISDAYAWVKGNHLDHFVAEEGEKVGLIVKKAQAGRTWGYFQFELTNNDEKCLAIVKPFYRTQETLEELENKEIEERENHYLYALMKNNDKLELHKFKRALGEQGQIPPETVEEVEATFTNQVLDLGQDYDRFYIFLYEIDPFTKMLSQIKLVLPDPQKLDLLEIDDLTEYISNSQYSAELPSGLTREDLSDVREFVAGKRAHYRINQIDESEFEGSEGKG